MTHNIYDLRLRLENSAVEQSDYLVKTGMDQNKLIEVAENLMDELEREADDLVTFEEHKNYIEENADVVFIDAPKIEAVVSEEAVE